MSEPTSAIVPVKSAFWSRINWAALISLVAGVLSIWGIAFPPEAQEAILKLVYAISNAITVLGPFAIVIFRTFFTKSVTPSAVSDAKIVDQTKTVGEATPAGPVVTVHA